MNQIFRSRSFAPAAPETGRDVAAERLHRKQRLAAAYRIFAARGYDVGLAGHITVRDPEHHDRFWVAPIGPWFGHIRVSDLVQVDHDGAILHGDGPINQAGFAIHSALHKARPDVNAAAHSHSRYGKAFSTFGRLLDPLTQDACLFYERHAVFEAFTGIVLDTSEGQRIAAALGDGRAAILMNHGILTVGGSVDSAVSSYVALEDACETQLLAEAAGTPVPIAPEIARHTASQMQGEALSAFAFRALYERIVREQPDLLD